MGAGFGYGGFWVKMCPFEDRGRRQIRLHGLCMSKCSILGLWRLFSAAAGLALVRVSGGSGFSEHRGLQANPPSSTSQSTNRAGLKGGGNPGILHHGTWSKAISASFEDVLQATITLNSSSSSIQE